MILELKGLSKTKLSVPLFFSGLIVTRFISFLSYLLLLLNSTNLPRGRRALSFLNRVRLTLSILILQRLAIDP